MVMPSQNPTTYDRHPNSRATRGRAGSVKDVVLDNHSKCG